MELLLEITDRDAGVGSNGLARFDQPYVLRKAARAVLFDKEGSINIQYVESDTHHKLPGGGVDQPDEMLHGALRRELREEAGVKGVKVEQEVGLVIEYRNQQNKLQISYCYIAYVEGEIGEPQWTEKEKSKGFVSMWVPLDKAITLLESDKTESYAGNFHLLRDLAVLKKAKEILLGR